jgi:hypothetical protein
MMKKNHHHHHHHHHHRVVRRIVSLLLFVAVLLFSLLPNIRFGLSIHPQGSDGRFTTDGDQENAPSLKSFRKPPARFFVGILCPEAYSDYSDPDDSPGRQQQLLQQQQLQQLIRSTYLSFYKNTTIGDPQTICSWNDFQAAAASAATATATADHDGDSSYVACRIVYTFVVARHPPPYDDDDHHQSLVTSEPDDVTHLDITLPPAAPARRGEKKQSASASAHLMELDLELDLSLAWFQHATVLAETFHILDYYIAVARDSCVLQFPILLDAVDRHDQDLEQAQKLDHIHPNNRVGVAAAAAAAAAVVYGDTPFVNLNKCLDSAFRTQHSQYCQTQTTGRFYFMSPILAKYVATTFPTQGASWRPGNGNGNGNGNDNDAVDNDVDVDIAVDVDVAIREHALAYPATAKSAISTAAASKAAHDPVYHLELPGQPYISSRHRFALEWSKFLHMLVVQQQRQQQPLGAGWRGRDRTGSRGPSITYLTGKFGRVPRQFAQEVQARRQALLFSGLFETKQLYTYDTFPDFIRNDPSWAPHLEFTNINNMNASVSARGGGFWFWKGPLVLHHLEQQQTIMLMGDVLVFADLDLWDHIEWIPSLIDTMVEQQKNLALYQMTKLEQEWTKRDVFEEFCPGEQQQSSFQYSANFIVVRKAPATIDLMRQWSQAMSNYHWINDEPSNVPNVYGFQEHRHDQSLLSVILKCRFGEPGKQRYKGKTTLNNWSVEMFQL